MIDVSQAERVCREMGVSDVEQLGLLVVSYENDLQRRTEEWGTLKAAARAVASSAAAFASWGEAGEFDYELLAPLLVALPADAETLVREYHATFAASLDAAFEAPKAEEAVATDHACGHACIEGMR